MTQRVLAVNTGSSTTKLAVFDLGAPAPELVLRAQLRHEPAGRRFEAWDGDGEPLASEGPPLESQGAGAAVLDLLGWIEDRLEVPIAAVGHRVVHGGPGFVRPVMLSEDIARALKALAPLAPLHQSASLAATEAIRRARPDLPQAVAFDTAFHHGHDAVVDRLGLPRTFEAQGLRRFGFHGLSYEFLAGRLRELDPPVANGRVIAAHLGSGASLCAVRAGRSVDTTMGATPLDGLLMGTRCGSIDPGVILFLQQTQGLDPTQLSDLLYHRSGLLGVSGLSADMRVLLQSREAAAREAIELFVFRVAREAAALAGSLGGLDGLVFTAGIGENCPEIRSAVCKRLAWLGVTIDEASNRRGDAKISAPDSRVAVWVIPTDEERMIAVHAGEALGWAIGTAAKKRAGFSRGSR
jgi:acetate kinase